MKRELSGTPQPERIATHNAELPTPGSFALLNLEHGGTDYDTKADIAFLVRDGGHRQHVVYRWSEDGRPSVIWHHHWVSEPETTSGAPLERPSAATA